MGKSLKYTECGICNEVISNNGFHRHILKHKTVINTKQPNSVNGSCEFCDREFKTQIALKNHQCRCPSNPDKKLQVRSEEGRRRAIAATKARKWTDEQRERHSKIMKNAVLNNPDSYTATNVCGRVKVIEYNGVKFHGKWEVEVAKWLDKHNIKWERNVPPFNYFWNNRWHLYFPDFYLPELDTFVEVKGYETDRDRAKWLHFPKKLRIIKGKEITQIRKGCFGGL